MLWGSVPPIGTVGGDVAAVGIVSFLVGEGLLAPIAGDCHFGFFCEGLQAFVSRVWASCLWISVATLDSMKL